MKKIIIALLLLIICIGMTSCNYEPINLQYNYNYAIIQLPNGEVIEGRLEAWSDHEGEQLDVKINGICYLASSYNCVLIYDPGRG